METHQEVNPQPSLSSWSFSLVGLGLFSVSLDWAGAEWSWALGRLRQIKRPRSWRTGVTLRQVSLQPTQFSQHNWSERRKPGRGRHVPAPMGEGRRTTDRSQREGPQTRRLEGKGLDLRGHHLCRARNSQGTNPRTVAGERLSSPAEAMMQASVVAGIMACCGELGLRGRSRFRAPRVVTSNLKKLNERFRVCDEQKRTCATAQGPATLPLSVVPGRARHVPAPSGGVSGLSFCCVLPPSLLSCFVFPCWFPG